MIMDIKYCVQEISRNIRKRSNILNILKHKRRYCTIFYSPLEFIKNINLLIKEEEMQFISLIKDFTTSIQSWTELHQKELLEVEQELEKQVAITESFSGQGAIDLQRIRLHEHIENLNKISHTL